MTTRATHYSNQLLPSVEWEGIPEDEKSSRERVDIALSKLENLLTSNDTVDPVLFGRCSRLLKHHRTLKYHFDVSLASFLFLSGLTLNYLLLSLFPRVSFCFFAHFPLLFPFFFHHSRIN
jgi:hypothetical protein